MGLWICHNASVCKAKHTWVVFLLAGMGLLCLHCAKARPQLPWPKPTPHHQPKTYDLNKDGHPDVFYTYEKTGASSEETVDWNGDGIPEVHRFFENGQLVMETYDLNTEGKPSLWLYYDKGSLALREWDEDGDGEPDGQDFVLKPNLLDFLELFLSPLTRAKPTNASTPKPPPCCPSP
ncbi:MAG: hypothetical protein FWC28_08680 [Proteobacteria bacterium]|nr:hypothetical protein [Cystobacterineae bacterium]MCL2315304.1 hypothetical protein [Pseudomonadota bacterium]